MDEELLRGNATTNFHFFNIFLFKVLDTTLSHMNWNIKRPVGLPALRYVYDIFFSVICFRNESLLIFFWFPLESTLTCYVLLPKLITSK